MTIRRRFCVTDHGLSRSVFIATCLLAVGLSWHVILRSAVPQVAVRCWSTYPAPCDILAFAQIRFATAAGSFVAIRSDPWGNPFVDDFGPLGPYSVGPDGIDDARGGDDIAAGRIVERDIPALVGRWAGVLTSAVALSYLVGRACFSLAAKASRKSGHGVGDVIAARLIGLTPAGLVGSLFSYVTSSHLLWCGAITPIEAGLIRGVASPAHGALVVLSASL